MSRPARSPSFLLGLLTGAAFVAVVDSQPGIHQCHNTPDLAPSACLNTEFCCRGDYFKAAGCTKEIGDFCCAPGAKSEPSKTLPNCLVIGDSVSAQYTPSVARLLEGVCQVQHAPYMGGGSAGKVASGLQGLTTCNWLRTALRPDQHVNWDIIQFNFGLHDLVHIAGAELDLYTAQLDNVTQILLASGARHVQYALTTPYEADDLEDCGKYCNSVPTSPEHADDSRFQWPQPIDGGNGRCGPPRCTAGSPGCGVPNATAKAHGPDPSAPGCGPPSHAVSILNGKAKDVMAKHGVPLLDLNSEIHKRCGATYGNCSLCDDETRFMGIRCGYHYAAPGVAVLANAVAASFRALLGV